MHGFFAQNRKAFPLFLYLSSHECFKPYFCTIFVAKSFTLINVSGHLPSYENFNREYEEWESLT